jgi:hypothetical protein
MANDMRYRPVCAVDALRAKALRDAIGLQFSGLLLLLTSLLGFTPLGRGRIGRLANDQSQPR